MDQASLYAFWQKISFELVHKTTIWVLLLFIGTAGAAWHLGNLLQKHNNREQEVALSKKTALGYTILALVLWLFSFIMR